MTGGSPRDCKLTFFIGRGCAELQILKKWKWPYLLNYEEYCDIILHTKCSQWDCQMTTGIGRGFKFWKKANWPYLLNRLVYFDKILHTHYYWHDLDRGIANSCPRDWKWHLTSVEAVPSSQFWKSENCRTESTIVMKLCIHIDIERCSRSDCQMAFGIGRGFAEVQFLKKSETYGIFW